MTASNYERVTYASGDVTLVGHLFRPAGQVGPGVVVTGSWTTVKEQMLDLYAAKLAKLGFTALTFDFTYYGESEGEIREFEDPLRKVDDIAAAALFLAAHPAALGDVAGGLAICASAGYMSYAIADGAPIAAFATVAAWLHDPETVGAVYGGEDGVATRRQKSAEARKLYDDTRQVRHIPAFSATTPMRAWGNWSLITMAIPPSARSRSGRTGLRFFPGQRGGDMTDSQKQAKSMSRRS